MNVRQKRAHGKYKKLLTAYFGEPVKMRSDAQKAADKRYADKVKNKYKRFGAYFLPSEFDKITEAVDSAGLSNADFIRLAAEHFKEFYKFMKLNDIRNNRFIEQTFEWFKLIQSENKQVKDFQIVTEYPYKFNLGRKFKFNTDFLYVIAYYNAIENAIYVRRENEDKDYYITDAKRFTPTEYKKKFLTQNAVGDYIECVEGETVVFRAEKATDYWDAMRLSDVEIGFGETVI